MSIDNNIKIQTPYNPNMTVVSQISSGAKRRQKGEGGKTDEENLPTSEEKKEAVEKENKKSKDSLSHLKGKNISLLI